MIYRVSLTVGRNEDLLASTAKQGAAILCARTCSQGSDMCILSTSVHPHRILPFLQSPSNPHQIEGLLRGTWKEAGLLTHYEAPAESSIPLC